MKKKTRNLVAIIMLAFILVGITGGIAMLQHSFAAPGQFDPVYYAQTYPDVAAALGTDATVLYNHYISFGQKEGRIPYAGGQPGEIVDGIAGTTTQPQAPATTGQLQTATGLPLPSPENPKGTPIYPGSNIIYDFSNWTSAQWDNFYRKQAEFDASEYAKVGWTEAQVQERLLSLKSLYPEGTKVGECGAGAGKIQDALYGDPWDWDVGFDKNEQQVLPIGFVYKQYTSRMNGNMRDFIRIGDEIQIRGADFAGHVMVVLSRDDYGITVVESNWNGDEAMHWGRRISWDTLETGGSNSYSMQDKLVSVKHRVY